LHEQQRLGTWANTRTYSYPDGGLESVRVKTEEGQQPWRVGGSSMSRPTREVESVSVVEQEERREEYRRVYVERSKRRFRRKVRANGLDHLWTFTQAHTETSERLNVNSDIASHAGTHTQQEISCSTSCDTTYYTGAEESYARFYERRVRPFQRRLERAGISAYLMCAERQKSGWWHLHVAMRGFVPWEWLWHMWSPSGRAAWEAGGKQPGAGHDFVFVSGGKRGRQLSFHQLASYMGKYITKEASSAERRGHHLYWQGRGTRDPQHEDMWTGSIKTWLLLLYAKARNRMQIVCEEYEWHGERASACAMGPPAPPATAPAA